MSIVLERSDVKALQEIREDIRPHVNYESDSDFYIRILTTYMDCNRLVYYNWSHGKIVDVQLSESFKKRLTKSMRALGFEDLGRFIGSCLRRYIEDYRYYRGIVI